MTQDIQLDELTQEKLLADIKARATNNDELANAERAKYTEVFKNPHYRRDNQGLQLWELHREIFPSNPKTAIDIGCGNGALFKRWVAEGIDGVGIDFINNGVLEDDPDYARVTHVPTLWVKDLKALKRFDLGVCADVMEHIPPDRVDDVLANVTQLSNVTVFQIANYPSNFGDLHLTLQPAYWWQRKLERFGTVERIDGVARDGVEEYVFRFEPHQG